MSWNPYLKLLYIMFYSSADDEGDGWLGFPDLWSGQKPWRNCYLTPVVNFGEVRRAQLAKSTLLTSSLVHLGSFQILRFVQMLKIEWDAESNKKLPHLFIPSKTATYVSEFVMGDVPLGRIAAFVHAFAVKDLPLGRTRMIMIFYRKMLNVFLQNLMSMGHFEI